MHSEVVYGCTYDANGLTIPDERVVGDDEGSIGYFLQYTRNGGESSDQVTENLRQTLRLAEAITTFSFSYIGCTAARKYQQQKNWQGDTKITGDR